MNDGFKCPWIPRSIASCKWGTNGPSPWSIGPLYDLKQFHFWWINQDLRIDMLLHYCALTYVAWIEKVFGKIPWTTSFCTFWYWDRSLADSGSGQFVFLVFEATTTQGHQLQFDWMSSTAYNPMVAGVGCGTVSYLLGLYRFVRASGDRRRKESNNIGLCRFHVNLNDIHSIPCAIIPFGKLTKLLHKTWKFRGKPWQITQLN